MHGGGAVTRSIRVLVEGIPAPKGSFRISMRGRRTKSGKLRPTVRKDSPATETWERLTGWAGRAAMTDQDMLTGKALRVVAYFRMPRPDGHYYATGRNAGKLRDGKRWAAACVKPDIDKLLRSTFDALEGIVYDQDSRIVSVEAHKGYVGPAETPGAVVTIQELA
jgi:Holliday junction resolvase RusA-like endonuclease